MAGNAFKCDQVLGFANAPGDIGALEEGEGSMLVGPSSEEEARVPQAWRLVGEEPKVTEIITKLYKQGEWAQSRLTGDHADMVGPKAGAQVCDQCGRTGFQTFDEAWQH